MEHAETGARFTWSGKLSSVEKKVQICAKRGNGGGNGQQRRLTDGFVGLRK